MAGFLWGASFSCLRREAKVRGNPSPRAVRLDKEAWPEGEPSGRLLFWSRLTGRDQNLGVAMCSPRVIRNR